jgi:uncharacterized protein (DUF983 family)
MKILGLNFDKTFWKQYLIAGIIVSMGAFFIHVKDYSPPNFNSFFMWLPSVWILLFALCFIFGLVIGVKE